MIVLTPPAWHDEALCAQIGDVDLFHPGEGGDVRPAIAVCQACPVRAECLDWVMRVEDTSCRVGVYGGTSPRERAALARQDGRLCPRCGDTPLASGARMCRDCRDQSRAATQSAYNAKRQRCRGCGNRVRDDMPCPHCLVHATDREGPAA